VHISTSAEVCPEFREYFRASTTVVNAAIAPIVSAYLNRVETRLRSAGFAKELCVMQSNGGVYTSEIARRKPVHLVESGPAAGVIVAAHVGMLAGCPHVISLDIGGTTAKAGLIQDGRPKICSEFEVGAKATGRLLNAKATGYPIKSSVLDLVEIGAGGGSIAWVDGGGALRVGPRSAGADPGPACYGRGGLLPTLTDAHLLLGHLNPDYFLGGRISLSVGKAREAIERDVASKLDLDPVEAACGIVEIANANMIAALRLISVQRGFDPREFAMVAFGGAGPLHANAIAALLEIRKVIIPLSPGISSALGLLLTDIKHDFVRTYICRMEGADTAFVDGAFAQFERDGRQMLSQEGIGKAKQTFLREVDLRYSGQSFELKIPFPDGPATAASLAVLEGEFHRAHERAYGHSAPGEPVEIVNLRLTAVGAIPKPRPPRIAARNGAHAEFHKGERPVCFDSAAGYVAAPVYDRYRLAAEAMIEGPAIIEEFDSTTVLHPGYGAKVDESGSIQITPK
jgi:N-methylhydantoinase A